jgi:uncharacterized membrane protein
MNDYIYSFLISLLPIAELRGGIPFAIAKGISPIVAYLICVGANLLSFPITYFFLIFFHDFFMKMSWYANLFEKFVDRTRGKVQSSVDKYGFWGLMVFVMIPLPVTGAYTGSFAAWLFGFEKKKAFMAVSLGVIIAGVIVTAVVVGGMESFKFLTKDVH